MAIAIGTSFDVRTNLPIDERFKFSTIQDMKDMNPNLLYEGVLSYNEETGKYYTYSETNPEEEVLGKWKEFSSGSDIIYFNSKAEWDGARLAGELDPDKYYSYIGGFAKGSEVLIDPTTMITFFNSYEEWESERQKGHLDPNKYYSYPTSEGTHIIDQISIGRTANTYTIQGEMQLDVQYIIEKGFVFFNLTCIYTGGVPTQRLVRLDNFIPDIKDPGMTVVMSCEEASAVKKPVLYLQSAYNEIKLPAGQAGLIFHATGSYVVADGWRP